MRRGVLCGQLSLGVGVGQLVLAAIAEGATMVVVGLGGSATNDAGAGLLSALGAEADRALDSGGRSLARLHSVDIAPARAAVAGVTLIAATDVDNPLLGLRGAARNYGEQKGASPSECMDLDAALEHFAGLVGRRPDGKDPAVALGAGAAGGLGYALLQLGGERVPGIRTVMDILDLPREIADADLVVTGECCFDLQSLRGKVVSGIASIALREAEPCVVLAGQVSVGRRDYTGIGVAAAAWASTNAVVAICVVLVSTAAVGATGVPVSVGDALDALDPTAASAYAVVAIFVLLSLADCVGAVGLPVSAGLASAALRARSDVRLVTCDCAMVGMSAATRARNVGVPVDPLGAANTLFVV